MAPALVEHSAARERNSISRAYSKHCWSKIDLELYNFVQSLKLKTLPLLKRSSSFLEMNDSGKEDKQDISFAENKNDMVSFKDLPLITFPSLKGIAYDTNKTGYNNGTLNYKFEKSSPISVISNAESACIFSTKAISTKQDCIITKEAVPLPTSPTTDTDNAGVVSFIQEKKDMCGVKFSNISESIDKLQRRIQRLQSKNILSHVSTHVINHDEPDTCRNDQKTGIDVEKSWEDLRKLRDMICLRTNGTDSEDFEIDHGWHNNINNKRKKKAEDSPPSLEDLHQWKIQRASIGSQCSWLGMKISSLDQKISKLDKLYKMHKHETKRSLDTHTSNDTTCEQSEDSIEDEVCRRVLPFTDFHDHVYIKTKPSVRTPVYGCRCLPAVTPCYRCLHYQRQYANDSRQERTSRLDGGFHSRLSFKNDVSLSFLLEEALRKQRINTKVTISKPTKKKKKQKIKEGTGNNELNEKQPAANKRSLAERFRSRNERQKYDDMSRKRSSGLEPSGHGGRSRKSRKLSESEESWKPSTPTELNSPFSQNLSSSAFFPLKRKKNSSGASYDINNIVIPYSMAASTRVERIQYKEIPTPGWRSAHRCFNEIEESDEYEKTDDEAYTERHMKCEVNEKKKFADCYRHTVVRRRPNHLSESTASGPPSPLVSDELRPVCPTTPIDSPQTLAALLTNRLTNLILVPGDERDLAWPLRSYPLNPADCAKLSIVTTSSINTPNEWRTTNNTETITTTNKHLASTTTSTHSSLHSKYFESTTNSSTPPVTTTSPHRTFQHTTFDDTPPLPTPLYTPVDTPMPSPLSPDCEHLDGEGIGEDGVVDPSKWTVKERALEAVAVETGQVEVQQMPHSGGIVLKLAKQ